MEKGGAPTTSVATSDARFLAPAFGAGGFGVLAGFVFVVPFADLLLDFLGDQVNRRVEVALPILRKQVRSRHGEAHGTGELLFRSLSVVVLQGHSGINGEAVEMVELVEARA